jgi:hypothetical protein
VQTCDACPSQWDAWDSEGRYWYLRYRYGHGEARQYPDENWVQLWVPNYEAREVLSFGYGHSLDGVITLEKFAELAGLVLSPELQKS